MADATMKLLQMIAEAPDDVQKQVAARMLGYMDGYNDRKAEEAERATHNPKRCG